MRRRRGQHASPPRYEAIRTASRQSRIRPSALRRLSRRSLAPARRRAIGLHSGRQYPGLNKQHPDTTSSHSFFTPISSFSSSSSSSLEWKMKKSQAGSRRWRTGGRSSSTSCPCVRQPARPAPPPLLPSFQCQHRPLHCLLSLLLVLHSIDGLSCRPRKTAGCPLQSATDSGRSAAARAPQGCPAAPTEEVSSVSVGQSAARSPPPPPSPLLSPVPVGRSATRALHCGAELQQRQRRCSPAHGATMIASAALAASERLLCRGQPWPTSMVRKND